MSIKNKASISEPEVDLTRAGIEHRATWMALLFEETKKACTDKKAEEIFRTAIKKCGHMHGTGYKACCADPSNVNNFYKAFLSDNGKKNFEMDITEVDHDNLKIEFHYCPLVNAWKKLGIPDENLPILCDMAMDGDRGIAEQMGLKLNLDETIAKGNPTCNLHFHK